MRKVVIQLSRPRTLSFTAADELLAIERAEVLRSNGFDIAIEENAPPHERVKLTAHPVSKNTTFDLQDLEELVHLMHDTPPGTMVRCSRVRAMFASRACRKSVMVGHALNRRHMLNVSDKQLPVSQIQRF